jgi:hypothetical protein
MLDPTLHPTISPLIQASLSPVFLLTAIAATLAVVDTRQNRIVDRIRLLEAHVLAQAGTDDFAMEELEFYLTRTRRIGHAAMTCALAALCVAASVVTLFIDAQTDVQLAPLIEVIFSSAIILYAIALLVYLRDVFAVNRGMRFIGRRLQRTTSETSDPPEGR